LAHLRERIAQLAAGIAAIGEAMAQPREAVADAGEQVRSAVAILDARLLDHRPDQEALGVGDDMALAALDLFTGIIAPWSAALGRLQALTVDDRRGRTGFATDALPVGDDQRMVDLFEQAGVTKYREPVENRFPWRKLAR